MTAPQALVWLRLLGVAPLLLLVLVALVFGLVEPTFVTPANLVQILAQAAPIAVVAAGMTMVLLTGGVDLSVGAVMFIGAGLAGHLALAGYPLVACGVVMVVTGLGAGIVNAWLVARVRVLPFVATLATLYVGRGIGRWITETRAMNLPDVVTTLAGTGWLGLPVTVWVAGVVACSLQWVLSSTPFGRQVYALGANPEAARAVGLPVRRLTATVYVISGACAGVGGALALLQLGAVSPRFGELYEFDAITASVLGGTSLFGGHGRVLPGAVVGAVLLRAIFGGLVVAQVDPYVFPMITAAIILFAVLLDTLRLHLAARLARG
jgi:ribose transport system permease protein